MFPVKAAHVYHRRLSIRKTITPKQGIYEINVYIFTENPANNEQSKEEVLVGGRCLNFSQNLTFTYNENTCKSPISLVRI